MYGCRLGLELHADMGLPLTEQIRLLRRTGFDAFFAYWDRNLDVAALRRIADEENMIFQSLHAPGGPLARHLWYESDETENSLQMLFCCLRDCAANGVPIMVLHSFYGFDLHAPTEQGLKNYGLVIDEARRLGVKIALENLEGEEYLAALLERFGGDPSVGFCWDVGHEMCYTHRDLMAEHGKYIIATHLNDNLGASDFEGAPTGLDDLHLLPFDGIGDWRDIAARLNRWGYDDVLMFELKPGGQPGRHESDAYRRMSPEEFAASAYMRCCRVAALYMAGRKNR
jgi:sugar phosphate isomerase/epimerase